MKLLVKDCDITKLDVDAITNAANGLMIHGAGVAGAIRKAGGPSVSQRPQRRVPIGAAHVTSGGNMPCKYVIHAVTMDEPGSPCDALTAWKATHAALGAAEALGFPTLALPAFGTGVGGLGLRDCSAVMVAAVESHQARSLKKVTFAVFGAPAELGFRGALIKGVGLNELRKRKQLEDLEKIRPLWCVRIRDVGERYLTAPSGDKARENAEWIWPNNAVDAVWPVDV